MKATINEDIAFDIRCLAADGVPFSKIAERFGLSMRHVGKVVFGVAWKNAPGPVRARRQLGAMETAFVEHFKSVVPTVRNMSPQEVSQVWNECWSDWQAACRWAWQHAEENHAAPQGV